MQDAPLVMRCPLGSCHRTGDPPRSVRRVAPATGGVRRCTAVRRAPGRSARTRPRRRSLGSRSGSSRFVAADRDDRDPATPAAAATPATALPCSVCSSSAPSPVTTRSAPSSCSWKPTSSSTSSIPGRSSASSNANAANPTPPAAPAPGVSRRSRPVPRATSIGPVGERGVELRHLCRDRRPSAGRNRGRARAARSAGCPRRTPPQPRPRQAASRSAAEVDGTAPEGTAAERRPIASEAAASA